jgi:hypothetical protein
MSCRNGVSGTRCRGWAAAMTDFEITVPGGPMVCGYCGREERWANLSGVPEEARAGFRRAAAWLTLGYLSLTGDYLIGVGRDDGRLVVLVEAKRLNGDTVMLPHFCPSIPDAVRARYAAEIAASAAGRR